MWLQVGLFFSNIGPLSRLGTRAWAEKFGQSLYSFLLENVLKDQRMRETMEIVSTSEMQRLIAQKGNYVLIDVRESDELEYGMIPTAKNIPLGEIESALDLDAKTFQEKYSFSKPQKTDILIFHCRTGGRSAVATQIAQAKGFVHAKNYKGSIWEWSQHDSNVQRYGPQPHAF